MKKRNRLSMKCKATRKRVNGPVPYELEEKIGSLKCQIQSEARRAYWNYVESIFTSDDDDDENSKFEGMKRFWRFVKYCTTDLTAVIFLC